MSENRDDPFAPPQAAEDPFATARTPSQAAADPFATPPADLGAKDPFDIDSIDSSGVPEFDVPAPEKPVRNVAPTPATPTSSKPRCATHPDRFARSTACERCGNYACESCFSIDNERYCTTCAERVGMVVPWENSNEDGVFRRLVNTCTHLAQAPFERFGQISDGDLGRALSFTASICLASYGATVALCGPFLLLGFGLLAFNEPSGDAPGAAIMIPVFIVLGVIFPFLVAAMHMLSNLMWGSIYHLGAKLAGGQASYTSSLRAAQYQSILIPADVLVSFVSNMPLIGPLISLGWLAAKNVLCIFAYAGHARTQHRLEGGTAWLVGAVPTLLALMLFVGVLVLAFAVVFATIGGSPLLSSPD
jgi:hypothetical protein